MHKIVKFDRTIIIIVISRHACLLDYNNIMDIIILNSFFN